MSLRIPDFSKARLLVAGDVMLDRYWSGATQRISPEAPVPVVRVQDDQSRPGGAANVAINIAALGATARLLGVVGADDAASSLDQYLSRVGVVTEWVEAARLPTITKLRVLSRHQQVIRLDFEESLAVAGAFDRGEFLGRFGQCLDQADAVVLSDYNKGTLVDVEGLIADAYAASKPILVDPKGSDFSRYRGSSLITPNLSELEAVIGSCPDEKTLFERAERLRIELEMSALLITRSEKGMTLIRPSRPPLHLPAQAQEVFDVTGAGDTVIASIASALATGETIEDAVRLANLAAGIVVGKLGTASVTPGELSARSKQSVAGAQGLVSRAYLLSSVAAARSRGQKIVFTNGCFDILHAGHLRYLQAARELGDLLIVAVNDDDSVRRLKGESRPVNACADRMAMLAGLRPVDYVLPFSEDTPARLIAEILPDVLAKGGDYKPEQIAGHDIVKANGGKVTVLAFHEGYSTTSMLARAAEN